jgi:hypothetical protein
MPISVEFTDGMIHYVLDNPVTLVDIINSWTNELDFA